MKTAVVYYSLDGNTRLTGEKIAGILGADLIELKPVKAYPTGKVSKFFWGGKSATFKEKPELERYDFNPDDYDTVVVGTPLWAWTVTPPVRTFISENDLSLKRVAAFVCCGGGKSEKAFTVIKDGTNHTELSAEMTVVNALSCARIDEKVNEFCKKLLNSD